MLARRLGATSAAVLVLVVLGLGVASVAVAHPSAKPFEIVPGSFQVVSSSGQAGAHGDLTTSFDFAHNAAGETFNDVRTTVVELPVGFVGSSVAVPTCTQTQLLSNGPRGFEFADCPVASQVGTLEYTQTTEAVGLGTVRVPLYNMQVASEGVAAEFGFKVGPVTQLLQITVRPGDSGLTVTAQNLTSIFEVHNIKVTVWGVPAAPEHDGEREQVCTTGELVKSECQGGNVPAGIPPKPLLSTPTSCAAGPVTARLRADSWESPASWSEASAEIPPMSGCERVPFTPGLVVEPTTRSAESSSGLNVSLIVPQEWESPNTLSTSNLKDTVLALPVGYTANPSLAAGLGVCSPEQLARETSSSPPGSGCPPESKIGTVEVETPLLAEHLTGAVYMAQPFNNPSGSLLALYIVIKSAERGIIVKLAGKIEPNPVTGQLVTTFDENPQVPFSKFILKLRQGANSPLITPPACGAYEAVGAFTPWSQPLTPFPVHSSFDIETGIGGGPCPAGGIPPFKPKVISGTQNNAGGAFSPFYLRIDREDGEQELTRFSTTLPPGLTGNLTGIPFCPDANVEAAKARAGTPDGGAEEEASPSCPAASEIGHTIVEAGVGTVLAQTPGKIYLAGPYHGAPLSIVSITSAKVGPFDLGTVVIRFALDINPSTAQVEVSANGSDPIPHIIEGIVVHVRNIRVYMDRSKFIINPTNCSPLQITDTIDGAGADFTNPADQVPVPVNTPFEAADCSTLAFKPKFSASTEAKDHFNGNGASLKVNLSANQGPNPTTGQGVETNISKVKVELPISLPSRLTTLQKACTNAQFEANPAGCPAASNIGYATVRTPILPVPLTGPAIFVSHGGEAFPSLILVLQGYGITIDLTGATFISKSGITSSTFKTVPDQPFSTFELTLPAGKFSALAAITNVCKPTKTETVKKKVKVKVSKTVAGKRVTKTKTVTKKVTKKVPAPLLMPTEMVAQNGAVLKQSTKIAVTGCKAAKPAKKKKAKAKKKAKGKKK